MKRILIAAAALATLAASSAANAEPTRLSDWAFTSASHCLAYAELPQLQSDPVSITALREAVSYNRNARPLGVVNSASHYTAQVRAEAASADVTELRQRRDQLCEGFVRGGLVQLETATPAS